MQFWKIWLNNRLVSLSGETGSAPLPGKVVDQIYFSKLLPKPSGGAISYRTNIAQHCCPHWGNGFFHIPKDMRTIKWKFHFHTHILYVDYCSITHTNNNFGISLVAGSYGVSLVIEREGPQHFRKILWHFYATLSCSHRLEFVCTEYCHDVIYVQMPAIANVQWHNVILFQSVLTVLITFIFEA